MKISDDYHAKYRLWASNPQVIAALPAQRLPNFKSRKFSTHEEMNEWKNSVLKELARAAAAKWTN